MSIDVTEEAAPPRRPLPIRRLDLFVASILAICAGAALGAMTGSWATGTDEPLPDRPEVLAIARMVWDEREPDENWVTEEPVENLDSQTEQEDLAGIPGWVQILIGDATMDKPTGVYWPGPPGWVESYDEPYDFPETLEDNIRRVDEAEAAFAADGWKVRRPFPGAVEARKGTLEATFFYFDLNTPELEVRRVPPASHPWLTGIGALLGAAAGAVAVLAFIRHRRRHGPLPLTALGVGGLALLCLNFLVAVGIVWSQLHDGEGFDTPLWRGARFVPFGLAMNAGLVMIAVSAVALWRQRRAGIPPSTPSAPPSSD